MSTTRNYCPAAGCWLPSGHHGNHGTQKLTFTGTGGPLTCQCVLPNVGVNDECVRCRRVIARLVLARRAARALADTT